MHIFQIGTKLEKAKFDGDQFYNANTQNWELTVVQPFLISIYDC